MAYNSTEESEQAQYNLDDENSRVFEKALESDLVSLFNAIAADFVFTFMETGTRQDLEMYRASIEASLAKAYRRAMAFFVGAFMRNLEESIIINKERGEDTSEEEAILDVRKESNNLIWLLAIRYVRVKVVTDTDSILKTTGKIMDQQIAKATMELAAEGLLNSTPAINKARIAKRARDKIKKRNKTRARMIAESEVLSAGNKASDIEASEIAKGVDKKKKGSFISPASAIGLDGLSKPIANPLQNTHIKKKWITRRDSRVRAWHMRVHGQIRNVNEPYLVMGEYLMRPKDGTLGASGKNIMGCRCRSYSYWA